ncbi:3-hydroxy-2-methylpyridine-4,5-dicarboxylic acid decarboxylase [Burkholderia pseudomallei]|nr:3-hydroxy-2-methylpyridine-4,5-dicarboxylic acid decarboxylase [Burkholderia pseudomallei]
MCRNENSAAWRTDDVQLPNEPASSVLIADLVTANHILFDQGVVDAFGHVSVRHDKYDNRFLLARNMAPGQVSADDIIEFSLDGKPINAGGRRIYLERFIHSEIYRAWPDVRAVVHSHSPSIVPFSVVKDAPLRALFHMAGFIGTQAPVYEIRNFAGDGSDLLIRDARLGSTLAQYFATSPIVLMRGHGSTVVGESLQQTVYRAVYAEVNARHQELATQLGRNVIYLTEAECSACVASHEAQAPRPWEMWKSQALMRRR